MIVTFNTAKLAKEKGFIVETIDQIHNTFYNEERDLDTLPYYMNHYDMDDFYREEGFESVLAPNQSELQKWLRSKGVYVEPQLVDTLTGQHQYQIFTTGNGTRNPGKIYDTYEEALEEGLQQALKLIK